MWTSEPGSIREVYDYLITYVDTHSVILVLHIFFMGRAQPLYHTSLYMDAFDMHLLK